MQVYDCIADDYNWHRDEIYYEMFRECTPNIASQSSRVRSAPWRTLQTSWRLCSTDHATSTVTRVRQRVVGINQDVPPVFRVGLVLMLNRSNHETLCCLLIVCRVDCMDKILDNELVLRLAGLASTHPVAWAGLVITWRHPA